MSSTAPANQHAVPKPMLGYEPCKADQDLWMKKHKRSDSDECYYTYVLLYVDDCMAILENPKQALEELDKYFLMKKGSKNSIC